MLQKVSTALYLFARIDHLFTLLLYLVLAGPFAIIDGRHAVLEKLERAPLFQQNDLYLTECSSFHLITGPNMCGTEPWLLKARTCHLWASGNCLLASLDAFRVNEVLSVQEWQIHISAPGSPLSGDERHDCILMVLIASEGHSQAAPPSETLRCKLLVRKLWLQWLYGAAIVC